MRLTQDEFLIGGSGYMQTWHMRWFAEHLCGEGVSVANVTEQYGGVAIVGPESRRLLQRVCVESTAAPSLPFMGACRTCVGFAPAIVARLSVTGELGYEIYVPVAYLQSVYELVRRMARDMGGTDMGLYALNSLRLEKSFGIWSREYSRDYTPRMAGLERFIAYDKPAFIGRDPALRDRDTEPHHRLVTLAIDAVEADATGYEPIYCGAEYVGFVTSGGYGHCAGTSIAMGYVASSAESGAVVLR